MIIANRLTTRVRSLRHSIHLIALVAILFISMAQAEEQPPPETTSTAKPTLTVSVVTPMRQQIRQTIQASGSIEAREIAAVTSQATGLSLMRLHADVGDLIKTGQLLAEYDDAAVKNDIAQAKASLQQAQVALEQARANVKRTQRLRKSQAISAIEADNFVYQEKQAKAQLDSAKAVLDNQTLRASYARVKAQLNGLIIEKQAVLGEVSNPGTKLFSVIVDNQLEWQANVPSDSLPMIKAGLPVAVSLSQLSPQDTSENQVIKGLVRKIDPTVNARTRLGKVYVSMAANDNLKRGLFLRGEFILGESEQFVIPLTAVVRKDGFNYIFIVGSDLHVKRIKVSVGQLHENGVTVLSGLKGNERIVKTGVGFLNNGDLVHIAE